MSACRTKVGGIRRKDRYETARECVVKRGISRKGVNVGARFARHDADSSGENDTTATSSQTTKRNMGGEGRRLGEKKARKGEIPDTSKSRVPPISDTPTSRSLNTVATGVDLAHQRQREYDSSDCRNSGTART